MRRITLYAGTAFLAFVCGVLANSLVQKYFRGLYQKAHCLILITIFIGTGRPPAMILRK